MGQLRSAWAIRSMRRWPGARLHLWPKLAWLESSSRSLDPQIIRNGSSAWHCGNCAVVLCLILNCSGSVHSRPRRPSIWLWLNVWREVRWRREVERKQRWFSDAY